MTSNARQLQADAFSAVAAGATARDPHAHLRQRERALCTCGLIQVGYRQSWAWQHTDLCPASELFRRG